MTFSTLGGVRVTGGSVTVPMTGSWSGDLSVDGDLPPTLTRFAIGNLTMTCAIVRGGATGGDTRCRVVGGFGGWRKVVAEKQYAKAQGVRVSVVLQDLARETGEQVRLASDYSLGSAYVRYAGAASQALRILAPRGWYVDTAGVTQLRARSSTRVRTDFTVIDMDSATGVAEVATEDYAAWLPGAEFSAVNISGTYNVRAVTFRMDDNGKTRLLVMT